MRKGFTLIELLVVVLIIGILAAVALPQYTKAVEKSRTAEALTLMGDLATAQRIYQMTTGNFTKDLNALDIEMPGISDVSGVLKTKNYIITVTKPTTTSAAASGGFTVKAERAINNEVLTSSSAQAYTLYLTLAENGVIERYCQNVGNGKICESVAGSNGIQIGSPS